MKQELLYLDELTDKTGLHKVRVKVIDNSRPIQSPGKKRYQRLLLQDTKGNTMRAALFQDDIEAYDTLLQRNAEYELLNTTIRPVDPNYRFRGERYQMSFSNKTIIQPVGGIARDQGPQYYTISTVPKSGVETDRFDMLGVVIFVEGKARPIKASNGQEYPVWEIVITDHSTDQLLTISAWNDLAIGICDSLSEKVPDHQVVGFTALKPATHKGFSLGTSVSTYILTGPQGERANHLRKWAIANEDLITRRGLHVERVRNPPRERVINTIEFVKQKKATDVLQEEKFWVHACIPECEYDLINRYFTCSNCNKSTEGIKYATFDCMYCGQKECIALPRLVLTFDAADGTGSLNLTAYTENLEKLFAKNIDELYEPKNDDELNDCRKVAEELKTKKVFIEVGPSALLNRSTILKWVLKSISLDLPEGHSLPASSSDTSVQHGADLKLSLLKETSAGYAKKSISFDTDSSQPQGEPSSTSHSDTSVELISDIKYSSFNAASMETAQTP